MHGPRRARAESSRLRAAPAAGFVRSRAGSWICAWLAIALFALAGHAQTPPGTPISNTAQGVFTPPGGVPSAVLSNTDTIVTTTIRTPSTTQFLHYAPGYLGAVATNVGAAMCSTSGTLAGPFVASPNPTDLLGAPINLGAPVDLLGGGAYHQGEAFFVRVSDADQNLDPLVAESVLVTVDSQLAGDSEVVRAAETGPNTGVFVGYLMSGPPPAVSGDCVLSVASGDSSVATYRDPADAADSTSAGVLVDPLGVVFDSQTGAPVNGAQITLIDSGTGLPAAVFGDDGVSTFPSTVSSGGVVMDSGGTNYAFPPGGFRFPLVAPGTYRLQVVPPATHTFPSSVPDAALQLLPGAPYVLGPGSRGNDFPVPIGPIVTVDVPVDTANPSGAFTLVKRAGRATAGPGEFVPYTLLAGAPNGSAGQPAFIEDRLPPGFRFERGSLRIGGLPAPDPAVTADGRTLSIPLGVLAAGAQVEVRYVARLGAGVRGGKAVNEAIVRAGILSSNAARATMLVVADLLSERATLVGRVLEGSCADPRDVAHKGVAGVRIFLEDGTSVVTDELGRFHFPLVSADTHVAQLDMQTLPDGLTPAACEGSRFAGRAYSQFVEPQRGSLWRTDFFLERAPTARGLHQQLTVTPAGERQHVELRVSVGGATLKGISGVVMLPDGVQPVPGSLEVIGAGAEVDASAPVPTVRAAQVAPGGEVTLRFMLAVDPSVQVNAMASGRRGTGEPVRTPVVKTALDAKRSFTQTATWDELPPPPPKEPEELPPDAAFGAAWLAQVEPENRWVYPNPLAILRIPSTKVGIQHDPDLSVRLFLNGELVPPLSYDGAQKNASQTTAISRWRGVGLREGPNTFLAELLNERGEVVASIQEKLHSSGPPVSAELMPTLSTLVADGRIVPVVALKMFDRWGQPVREGMSGRLEVAAPHRAKESVERARERKLAVPNLGATEFVVGKGGIARIELEPTTTTGRFALTVDLADERREEIEGWLSPGRREFTLVALGTGELGFGDNSGDDGTRRAAKVDASDQQGRAALFATGTVRGDWQVTAAYDSDAERTAPGERLRSTLDTEEHFALYGDATEQRYEAPTANGYFLKVQRDRFYALYGDAETALSGNDLSRYERVVTGLKSEYYGEKLRFSGFASDTGQSFARDEIRGNGTSGLYRLSQSPVLVGSDRVRIEVRDRFRPGRVLDVRPQTAQIDYDLDPYSGTLHFRSPVPSRDAQLNPVLIVIEYEVDGPGDAISGGGRIAGLFLGGALEIGATGIHEGRGAQKGDLVGVDLTYEWDEANTLRAEWAGSDSTTFTSSERALAWLVSAEHRSESLELEAYAREQQDGFGLGQLSAIDQGARRVGADLRWRFRERWTFETSSFHEQNLATNDDRQIAESLMKWDDGGRRGVHAGARYVRDSAPATGESTGQLLLGGHYQLFGDKLTLRGGSEVGFGSEGPHGDYADRVGAGADYKLTDWLTLFAQHEITFGDTRRGQDTRVGANVTPWEGGQVALSLGRGGLPTQGAAGASATSSLGATPTASTLGEYGPRTYANLGIAQHWNLFERWGFDLSIDRSQTISGGSTPAFDPDVPTFSGPADDDYTAISIGAGYSHGPTAITTRVETRRGEIEDGWNLMLGALREHERTSYSANVEVFSAERSGPAPTEEDTYAARLSLAYRPLDTRWILLEQLEFEHGLSTTSGSGLRGDRVVNHLKLNYTRDERTQIALQYSAKWVKERIDGATYDSLGHLFGIEARQDFAKGWDIAFHARARQIESDRATDGHYSVGASLGRRLYRNVWASVGYNVIGFEDDEFSQADYTAKGAFLRLRVKVDGENVRDWLEWSPRASRWLAGGRGQR